MERPVLTAVLDGPPAQVEVDVELVEVLLAQQHPNLATLPLRACESGFDNFMFRLGESFAVRLPRSAGAARLIVHEQRWLITISDRLPVQIPVPIRVGQPGFGFPWRWSVVPWLMGSTAEVAPVAAREAPRLAAFLRALHVPAPTGAPRNAERATRTRRGFTATCMRATFSRSTA